MNGVSEPRLKQPITMFFSWGNVLSSLSWLCQAMVLLLDPRCKNRRFNKSFAKPSPSLPEIMDDLDKIRVCHFRPMLINEKHFSVCHLINQKVADAELA